MAERTPRRASQASSPSGKPRNSTGILSRITGSLFPFRGGANDLLEEELQAATSASAQPEAIERLPYKVIGDLKVQYFDCRDSYLLSTFGFSSGERLQNGHNSVFPGTFVVVVGARNGRLWVIPEDDEAQLAVPLEGSNAEELLTNYGFTRHGSRPLHPADHATIQSKAMTAEQLEFVKTQPDITVTLSGGRLSEGLKLVFSPSALQNGSIGYSGCYAHDVNSDTLVYLTAAMVVQN
eukprot:PhF_6_TR33839/c0_g1_i2/m.49630